jgi:ribulose 1,5-bisphosphate synthetase/thiazole synthase
MLSALHSRSAILANVANNNTQNPSPISDHDLRTVAISMKEAAVVIIGAGPAGLILALSLTKYKIHVGVPFRHYEAGLMILTDMIVNHP